MTVFQWLRLPGNRERAEDYMLGRPLDVWQAAVVLMWEDGDEVKERSQEDVEECKVVFQKFLDKYCKPIPDKFFTDNQDFINGVVGRLIARYLEWSTIGEQ